MRQPSHPGVPTPSAIPLNEDCWLGINGQPNSNEGADPPLTEAGYQPRDRELRRRTSTRTGCTRSSTCTGLRPATRSRSSSSRCPTGTTRPAFWQSVASTFKSNRAVVFDLFNEPYDPTDPRSGNDQNSERQGHLELLVHGHPQAGRNGGSPCFTSAYDENNNKTTTYRIAGLQTLLNAVRKAGAKQPVLSGGLDFANDLGDHNHGRSWMNHAPDDPLNQEAASFHNYMGKVCDNTTCWKNAIAPVAAHVPVVTGEFDEDNFDERKCHETPSNFDANYMNWADSAGVSYLAWGWIVETQARAGRRRLQRVRPHRQLHQVHAGEAERRGACTTTCARWHQAAGHADSDPPRSPATSRSGRTRGPRRTMTRRQTGRRARRRHWPGRAAGTPCPACASSAGSGAPDRR